MKAPANPPYNTNMSFLNIFTTLGRLATHPERGGRAMNSIHFLATATLLAVTSLAASAQAAEEPNCDGAIEDSACTGSEVPVADFPGVLCAVPGDTGADCPSAGEAYYGQDANYDIDPEEESLDGTIWKESITGLWWTTAADAANSLVAAEQVCTGYASAETAGAGDWRVPTMRELSRIISMNYNEVSYRGSWPVEFTQPQGSTWWTSTPTKDSPDHTITVSGDWPGAEPMLSDGSDGTFPGSRFVFCVSGPTMGGQWQVDEDLNVVVHTTTALTWQRDPQNVEAWSEALAYCEAATTGDFDDWRLPSIREALSMLDPDPSGDDFLPPDFTPDARSESGTPVNFYSSTPYFSGDDFGDEFTELGTYREDSGTYPFHYQRQDTLDASFDTAARCVRGPVFVPEPSAAHLGVATLVLLTALRTRRDTKRS